MFAAGLFLTRQAWPINTHSTEPTTLQVVGSIYKSAFLFAPLPSLVPATQYPSPAADIPECLGGKGQILFCLHVIVW